MRRGFRHGIPVISITLGDYMRPWQIKDTWDKIETEVLKKRLEGIKMLEDNRDLHGRFRSYTVTT